MEQIQKKRSMQVSRKFCKFLTRKGTTRLHLVLSVSVFSFLFSYYYYRHHHSLLSHSLNLAFAIRLLLTHSIDKTYVFLICNGILVLLAKISGSLGSESNFDLNEHRYIKNIHDGLQKATPQREESMLDDLKQDLVEDEELVRVDIMDGIESAEERGGDLRIIMENIGEMEMEVLSTEELNKKFDEFIRKMKEEFD